MDRRLYICLLLNNDCRFIFILGYYLNEILSDIESCYKKYSRYNHAFGNFNMVYSYQCNFIFVLPLHL
jgi:hypothetical protein